MVRDIFLELLGLLLKIGAVSKTGKKVGIRSNYQHYYVLNEILEQKSQIMGEEYAEIRLHRNKDDSGRIDFQLIPA